MDVKLVRGELVACGSGWRGRLAGWYGGGRSVGVLMGWGSGGVETLAAGWLGSAEKRRAENQSYTAGGGDLGDTDRDVGATWAEDGEFKVRVVGLEDSAHPTRGVTSAGVEVLGTPTGMSVLRRPRTGNPKSQEPNPK